MFTNINIFKFFFAYLPIAFGVAAVAASIYAVVQKPSALQKLLAFSAIPLIGLSTCMILGMFFGGWPTVLPHIVIGVTYPVVVVQLLLAKRQGAGKFQSSSRGFQMDSNVSLPALDTEYPAGERRW